MPSKGDYRRNLRPADREPVPPRIGIRLVEGIEPSGNPGTTSVDPTAFVCAGLAAELADEWVELAATSGMGVATMRCYRRAIVNFCEHVDATVAGAAEASLARAAPDLLPVILDWTRQLLARMRPGSTEPAHQAGRLRTLVKRRAQHPDRAVAGNLNGWLSGSTGLRRGTTQEVDEFTRADRKALIRAAWTDVLAVEQRLQKGRDLLERGVDPDVGGWLDPANLLRAIASGVPTRDLLSHLPHPDDWPAALTDLLPAGVNRNARRRVLLRTLVQMLYPHNTDLHGFRILLMAATGHTSEEVTGLTEEAVEFTPDGVLLTFTKNRARSIRRRAFTAGEAPGGESTTVAHLAASRLDVAAILRRLMAVTQPLRSRGGPTPVPLFLRSAMHVYDLTVTRFNGVANGADLACWLARMGVEVAGPVDIRRLRKSGKVEKALAYQGRVSDIADDHSVEVFQGHYAHGTTLKVLAGQVITAAQQRWFSDAIDGPTVLTPEAEDALGEADAPAVLGLSPEVVEDLRGGALDMGVSACRDPFDSPYGRPGNLCPVAPLRCLECRHALVLPSNLPQLLLLADHLDQLRNRLTPPHFHALWGQSHTNLTAVLADRTSTEIEMARKQIAAGQAVLHLPLSAHVEFDR